jgi:thiol-disulfide isomerase/thioredoxin
MVAVLALLGACGKSKVEESLPELTLTGLDGTQTSARSFRGKLLVLNVWATWCHPCRKEMPSLQRLSNKADSKRIIVAGIATDQSVNAVKEFMMLYKISFPIFTDTPSNVANNLGVRVFPETLLISPDGKIVQRIAGDRDWDSPAMLKVLEDAYEGKKSE